MELDLVSCELLVRFVHPRLMIMFILGFKVLVISVQLCLTENSLAKCGYISLLAVLCFFICSNLFVF